MPNFKHFHVALRELIVVFARLRKDPDMRRAPHQDVFKDAVVVLADLALRDVADDLGAPFGAEARHILAVD